jgi:exopolyphosphatase/guanosine-5'-triphosphate,3'-diphosphate pyrophosphatase
MIENADMAGFTTSEQRIMSKLILSQKGNLRKISEGLTEMDFAKAVLALRLAVMLMHSRAEIDYEDIRLKMKKNIELDMRRDWVSCIRRWLTGCRKKPNAGVRWAWIFWSAPMSDPAGR